MSFFRFLVFILLFGQTFKIKRSYSYDQRVVFKVVSLILLCCDHFLGKES